MYCQVSVCVRIHACFKQHKGNTTRPCLEDTSRGMRAPPISSLTSESSELKLYTWNPARISGSDVRPLMKASKCHMTLQPADFGTPEPIWGCWENGISRSKSFFYPYLRNRISAGSIAAGIRVDCVNRVVAWVNCF